MHVGLLRPPKKKAIEIKQPMNLAVVTMKADNLVSHVSGWTGPGSAVSTYQSTKLSLREHSTSQPEISRSIRNQAASFSEFTFPIMGA